MINKAFIEKLTTFKPRRPYVWELKITEEEFHSLEKDLGSYSPNAHDKNDALKIVVYIAEWYKRRYTNRAKKDYQKTFGGNKPDLETAWNALGINRDFLYQSKDGKNLYLHSTFILSGLAVKFELQRNETSFLKKLCRIFNTDEEKHVVDDPFETIVDKSHSIAFGCSIGTREHCLREFFNAIVNSYDWPYAKEDIDNEDTQIKALIERIKTINNDIKRSKFRLEWIINAPTADILITRKLRLWLNPEENDSKKRHLLRHDWIQEKWGLNNPGEMRYISIGLKYYIDEHLIQDADQRHPEMMFRNTGSAEVGFIADVEDYSLCNRVPVQHFNKVVIICWDQEGVEHEIIKEEIEEVKQFYRVDKHEDIWTDKTIPQKETALLFPKKYSIADISNDKYFEVKSFYNKKYGEGESVNWSPINVSVILQDENGRISDPYLNKQGYSKIVPQIYHHDIQYNEEGKLTWRHYDEDEETEIIGSISLIYQKEDLRIRFSKEKENEGNEDVEYEIISPDSIQFKSDNGTYIEWDEENQPQLGVHYLLVYARDRLINKEGKPYPVFYLPGGITRDCHNSIISYYEGEILIEKDCKDDISNSVRRKTLLNPSVIVSIRSNDDIIEIPVYQPTLIKEICYDGKIIRYNESGINFVIPYIQKDSLEIHDYSGNGYISYPCHNLVGLHQLFLRKRPNNPNAGWASSAAWENGDTIPAQDLDTDAPEWLFINLGDRRLYQIEAKGSFYFWNYDKDKDEERIQSHTITAPNQWGLIFESQRDNRLLQNHYPMMNEVDDDDWDDDGVNHYANVDVINCFKMAIRHSLYFYTFTPLKRLSIEQFRSQLMEPILISENKTEEQIKGLLRFADEFGYEDCKEAIIVELNKTI